MRMRVFMKKLRVEIENETRVYLESLDFEIEMRVSQKSGATPLLNPLEVWILLRLFDLSDSVSSYSIYSLGVTI